MRKLLLAITFLLSVGAKAQLATFDSLSLAGTDTFYINIINPGTDRGFNSGFLHFPYFYDSSFGGYWNGGFSYSKVADSTTSGFMNQYAAKAYKGYNNSSKYAVFTPGYGANIFVKTTNPGSFVPQSVYVTNSTYAYNSMRDGDGVAKKFGGVSGNDSDWFKITAHAYKNGVKKTDSVDFYLADFRSSNNAQDYIVKDWRLMNLAALGAVDSIYFTIASSDVGAFGMNTPAYFCLDNVQVQIPITAVQNATAIMAKVYPNPATTALNIDIANAISGSASILDMTGKSFGNYQITNGKAALNTSALPSGIYVLQLETANGAASMRFTKQ